jgi:DNA replication initiation complex subunit (GINS family)
MQRKSRGGAKLNPYEELYLSWRREIENAELGSLPADFFGRMAQYLRLLKEGSRMLDKKTLKATLLEHEAKHVRKMLEQIVWMRYEKLTHLMGENQKAPSEQLSSDEVRILEGLTPIAEVYCRLAKGIIEESSSNKEPAKTRRVVLRFLKDVPAIIGADMKTYGPFSTEDVASVHIDNARILVKQGLAVLVENV